MFTRLNWRFVWLTGGLARLNWRVALMLLVVGQLSAADLYAEKKGDQLQLFALHKDKQSMQPITMKQPLQVPLGSLWKLFVYAYNRENHLVHPPYRCPGISTEEVFCCKKGDSIDEETALAQSCGLYFEPQRLHLSDKKWRSFWRQHQLTYPWLRDLYHLSPATRVPLSQLLTVVDHIQHMPAASLALDQALMGVLLTGTARNVLPQLAGYARLKTYTWNAHADQGAFIGGFVGWRKDGVVIWGQGQGSSAHFLHRIAPSLEKRWGEQIHTHDKECVQVDFFADYPIASVINRLTQQAASAGKLNGDYQIIFRNGQRKQIHSSENLTLLRRSPATAGSPALSITGQMSLGQYIPRVLDREASTRYQSAAEALSIVIRNYVYQRGMKVEGCYVMPDTTKYQRVAANDPRAEALQIARKTSGLVLDNVSAIQYHHHKQGKNMLSWTVAKQMSQQGSDFTEILHYFFPYAQLSYHQQHHQRLCTPLPVANQWLSSQSRLWQRHLSRYDGYEKPVGVKVCQLSTGSPFTNPKTNEIFVRGFGELENQFSIAHEYLHLAFSRHPFGDDESAIDQLAKELVLRY